MPSRSKRARFEESVSRLRLARPIRLAQECSRRACSAAPIKYTTKTAPIAMCSRGSSGLEANGAPTGSRVEPSVRVGIMWKKKVNE